MTTYTGNSGNNSYTIARYGQVLTYDGKAGTDTLSFDRLAKSYFTISAPDSDGYITIDSKAGASATYHIRVKNVEILKFSNGSVKVDLTTLYPDAFSTTDTTAPTIKTLAPADEATGVSIDTAIQVTFSENVVRGTGDIVLKDADGNVIETYAAASSSNLSISGNLLTITPDSALQFSTGYSIEFAAGTVADASGNTLASVTSYNFTTASAEITGTAAANTINGTSRSDIQHGLAGNDKLFGLAASDTLDGGAGNDSLDGGSGADAMTGGLGNDTYVVDDAGDVVTEASSLATEIDTVESSVDYVLGANVEKLVLTGSAESGTGNSLNNTLTGNSSANLLDGGAGTDKLAGGAGDDEYRVDLKVTGAGAKAVASLEDSVTEIAGGGDDTVVLRGSVSLTKASTLVLGANLENLDASATGSSLLNLTGNGLANTLTGNDAANTLNGGAGADTMTGGNGDDLYLVDNVGDVVIESSGSGGQDKVQVSIAVTGSYTLGSNVEDAVLTNKVVFSLTGNALDNALTGNAAINTISGGDGDDTLDGGAGADTLDGGAGDDMYLVDNLADAITDASGADTIKATLAKGTYVLADGLENLILGGKAAINGTGNAADNTLAGNAAANRLDGGVGADAMTGGLGNDTYVVDDAGDVVTETSSLATEIDMVESSVDYVLGANVEKLVLTGSAESGTGNSLNNTLTGNSSANLLDGGAGTDKLAGGAGDDEYRVDLKVTGAGAKAVASLEDSVTEIAGGGDDTVVLRGSVSLTKASTLVLGANLENLDASATGSSLLNLTGNGLANTLTGNDAANTLNGGVGADSLHGGAGSDILIGGAGLDQLEGGNDADIFLFNTAASASNVDTLVDFVSGTDTIELSHAIFTKFKAGEDVSDNLGNSAPQDANDYLMYDSSTGVLAYDADGTGAKVAVQIAQLGAGDSHPDLVSGDIVII
ncbi:Ig-like domain-containing protein [Methylovorus mays]|uniref:Ig-like domain-containing protein n=1 Tax=Methylovorus mays TaxID=184077 RepID=UPI001E286E1C|nr:Ig-like domain-containing protein [Methylovorus mays]MCB5207811.1 Ig-like domain-containing protein [Methylovorus mays]